MANVVHKFEVGDEVLFKSKFTNINHTCGIAGREGTWAKITGIAPSYNNKPYYYIDNIKGEVFAETLFVGRYEE